MPRSAFGAAAALLVASLLSAVFGQASAFEVARAGVTLRGGSSLVRWGSNFSHTDRLEGLADHTSSLVANGGAAVSQGSAQLTPPPKNAWTIHHVFGAIIFIGFFLSIARLIPIVRKERDFFVDKVSGNGGSFGQFMAYRFTDWFTSTPYAPSLVLLFLTMALIVTGAIAYALLVGGSPSHALWRIFVWSTGSPAEDEDTGAGRFLGTFVTVCGLIILSLLLGIVSEVFTTKMGEIKSGMSPVVEGGHIVILGYSECTRCLLEELGKARESEGGGVFVVLAEQDKLTVEADLNDGSLNLSGSRVIVRSGCASVYRDLAKVSAGSAEVVVIMADTNLPPEDSDAKSMRTIIALRAKKWPQHGRIVVQCSCERNKGLFKSSYGDEKKVEVVVVGNIVARLMASSSQQHGLATVFGMMLGFDGDELYCQQWPDLVGCTFREAVFRFADAVAMGVLTASGECKLNPGWDYTISDGDKIIVLAEDNDTYEPSDEAWYVGKDLPEPPAETPRSPHKLRNTIPNKVLVIGWNAKVGSLLASLDTMLPASSSVDIYSSRPKDERAEVIAALQQETGHAYQTFTVQQLEADGAKISSHLELKRLRHHEYDSVFLLADGDLSSKRADERTIMCLTQLQHMEPEDPDAVVHVFDPVVEMCEDSTAEHLRICGFTNFVHSSSLVSQALAAVAENPAINSIYAELMSGVANHFEFRRYEDFLGEGEEPPSELSFWEAAYKVSLRGDISVIAWTVVAGEDDDEAHGRFEMNPKDKTTPRPWTPEDRLVVIRQSTAGGA